MENDQLSLLAQRLETVKKEVDAMQITIMREHVPWYRNVPTIISVLALTFSFGTTYVSYKHTEAQDIQNSRAELRAMLQRLAALPKENFELVKKHGRDALGTDFVAGIIEQEQALLAQQAVEVAEALPQDIITSTEYYAVGYALQSTYDLEQAEIFYIKAIRQAKEEKKLDNEISALRAYADLLFLSGRIKAGRTKYREAMNIFSRYEGYDETTQISMQSFTKHNWAYSEASSQNMQRALQHLAHARNLALRLPAGPLRNQALRGITQSEMEFTQAAAPISN